MAYAAEGGHPAIDCRPLFEAGSKYRAATLRQLKAALTAKGYFYAKMGELLPLELVSESYKAAEAAHALPAATLRAKYLGAEAPYRGYSDREPSYDGNATSSTVRSWDFGRDVPPLPPADPDYEYCGPNIYPDAELPRVRAVIDELYDRQDRLALAMFTALAEMFELPGDTFAQHFSWRSSSSLRLLFYPGSGGSGASPGAADPRAGSPPETRHNGASGGGLAEAVGVGGATGISPHTDYEMFTLMHQSASGLQIVPAGGSGWIDLPVRPADFVIIVGDMLERYTNGALRATPHRVLMTPWPRYSIIRFTAVNLAVDETVILLHPRPPLVGASIPMERERQQNDSLANG